MIQSDYLFLCPHCINNTFFNFIVIYHANKHGVENYIIEWRCCGGCRRDTIIKINAVIEPKIKSGKETRYCFNYSNPVYLDPNQIVGLEPSKDMPPEISLIFKEAQCVSPYSSRAAAALLRLALQKLFKETFGLHEKKLDDAIRKLATKEHFSGDLIKMADSLRITGNEAVHPGEMSDEDIDINTLAFFQFLNLIVHIGITQKARINEVYENCPEKKRRAAEEKDYK